MSTDRAVGVELVGVRYGWAVVARAVGDAVLIRVGATVNRHDRAGICVRALVGRVGAPVAVHVGASAPAPSVPSLPLPLISVRTVPEPCRKL